MTDYVWHDENYDKRRQLTIDSSKIDELYDGTSSVFTGSGTGWNGVNARYIIPPSRIGYKASTIKVKLGYYNTEWRASSMYIGHQAATGDVYDFDGNQVRVTFSGGYSGASVVTGGLWSDPIDIDIVTGKPLICAFYFNDTSYDDPPLCSTVENYDMYQKAGADDTSTTNATGYSQSGNAGKRWMIDQITAMSGTGIIEDFPVLIHLSGSSGITSADVTSVFDELTGSGTLYNIWNSNDKMPGITLSNNHLTAEWVGGSSWDAVRSTESKSSGKWYWEVKMNGSNTSVIIGVGTSSEALTYPGDTLAGYGYHGANGYKFHSSSSSYGATYTANDVIGVALDLDNGKIWWAKNGTWQASGDPAAGTNPAFTGVSGDFFAMVGLYNTGAKVTANFGSSSFTHTTPSGFVSGFSYLGDIPNDQKIAVYTTSGTQDVQCYVELENWVTTSGSEESWLWAKVPEVSNEDNTILYLYYDKDVSDNTGYVGYTGDYAAKQVWDDNFVGVWHMAQYPFASDTLDSTSNTNDGETNGSMDDNDLVSAKIGNGLDFDGSNDYLDCSASLDFDITAAITLETIFKYTTSSAYKRFIAKQYGGGTGTANSCYQLGVVNTSRGRFSAGSVFDIYSNIPVVNDGNWHHLVGTYDSSASDVLVMLDNSIVDSSASFSTVIRSSATDRLVLAGEYGGTAYFDNVLDEVRISNIARSSVWTSLTYSSNWDNLITFGAEEDQPSFIFNGYVKVQNVPSARTVYLYHRSTGAFVGTAVSNGVTGYFEIPTPFNDYHFVNILPELSESYNILVEDKIEQGS